MKARVFVAALALSSFTAGCTLGPNFARPASPATAYERALPVAAGTTRTVTPGGQVAADWYRLFQSKALEQLVEQALAGNPNLEAARHGLVAAQYELKAVSGAELPQIDATAKASRARINGSLLYAPTNYIVLTGNVFGLGPTLAYNVDLWGGVRRQIESQAAATAAARDQALDTYVTLVDRTVVTAFDYAATREEIVVTQALIDELQSQFELTRTLENAGKITRSDTLQARAQLENLRATLPALEQQRDAYRNALAQLCGSTPDAFTPPELSLHDFTLPTQLPVSLPSQLVRQRPDVLAAEDQLHEASAAIGVAEAARLPTLGLSASYSQQASAMNELFTRPGAIWSVGADVSSPIFHGGTLVARQHEAEARYRQSLATYRSTVVGAFVDVANALEALGHDGDSYAAHGEALAAARDDRDLAIVQYRAGKYTELQVLTAEQAYQQAALTQVQADAQRFTDTAALFRALGGGWWSAPNDPAALADAHGNPGVNP